MCVYIYIYKWWVMFRTSSIALEETSPLPAMASGDYSQEEIMGGDIQFSSSATPTNGN